MKHATVMNENQVRRILEEYLGRRKTEKVTKEIFTAVTYKNQYIHNRETSIIGVKAEGKIDGNEKTVRSRIESILTTYLEKDEVNECLEQIMNRCLIETIMVEGSWNPMYQHLLKHTPADEYEKMFAESLTEAVNASVKGFCVPVNDPSIDSETFYFVGGVKPAEGYSYNQLTDLTERNRLELGTKEQYSLFVATIIHGLMSEGWSESKAWNAVCCDSTTLGHYWNSPDAKREMELTGSRKVGGKCDLANTCKILAKDEETDGFWIVGGRYVHGGNRYPIAHMRLYGMKDWKRFGSVGWFVF